MPPSIHIPFALSVLALFFQATLAFRLSYRSKTDNNLIDGQQFVNLPDTDLTTLLQDTATGSNQVYTHALQVLESLKASPSCHRLAASTLIHSCQTVDGSSTNSEGSLEDLKSIYAAQLAICEITEAGSGPPKSCDAFLPRDQARLSQTLYHDLHQDNGLDSKLKSQLSTCLQSLESRPQHWTSYSNNRQNAVIMCQAARIHVDKDELIKLHQSMTKTASGADAALSRVVHAANEAMVRQEQFAKEVRRFQRQLMQDLEISKSETQSFLQSLNKNVDSILQNISKRLFAKVGDVEREAIKIQEALRSSTAEAEALGSNISKVLQQAAEGNAELAASQLNQWKATTSSTAELRNSLQSIREHEVHSLLGAFDGIHNQLRVSNELVAVMYARQHDMDQRLEKLDKSFAGLESTAAALHATHNADAEAQLRLHSQVQIEMQVAQGLLADITASAATLQNTVHDTSSKVAHMVALGGVTNNVLNWGWSLIVLLMVYHFHPKAAGYAAATLGALLLVSIGGLPPFLSHIHTAAASGILGHDAQMERIYHLLLCLCVLLAVVLAFRSSSRSQALATSFFHRSRSLFRPGRATSTPEHKRWKI
ncbi:MAG: hypothetical protein LQ352_008166 [Teloschistes flavicans]|nr:MAG: hypothetical protein LQ352_008166 [Teloschistes flavicans]